MPGATSTNRGVYLAGPLGFSDAGRLYHRHVLHEVLEAGFVPLDPWVVEPEDQALLDKPRYDPERLTLLPELDRRLGERNARLIEDAAGLLAILDGSDVDSGTAAEIGYAAALPRPVVGLRTDFRLSSDNEGSVVNLQVEYFIRASGGGIVFKLEDAIELLRRVLSPSPDAR